MTEDSRSLDHHANNVARHPQPFEGFKGANVSLCVYIKNIYILYTCVCVLYICYVKITIHAVVRNVNDLRSSRLCKLVNIHPMLWSYRNYTILYRWIYTAHCNSLRHPTSATKPQAHEIFVPPVDDRMAVLGSGFFSSGTSGGMCKWQRLHNMMCNTQTVSDSFRPKGIKASHVPLPRLQIHLGASGTAVL